jgi:predicted phosphate transport protein (TIGR00153 family)
MPNAEEGVAMFRFLFRKEQQVHKLIFKYLDNLKMTQEHFEQALDCYFDHGLGQNCDFLIAQTHKFESKADDIQNEIIELMYAKVLIPESRGDILQLLEAIDQIPTHLEDVLFAIQSQKLRIPEFIISDLRELMWVNLECCDLMTRQVEALFKKSGDIKDLVYQIDTNESRCDHIERQIIGKIFDGDLDPFQKLQLKDLVGLLGEISDQVDRVSRRIYIMSIKRRV